MAKGLPRSIKHNNDVVKVEDSFQNQVVISELDDFPFPVSGVITLNANTNYYIDGDVDISPNRIVCAANTSLKGYNSEISSITTDIESAALITTDSTMPIQDLTLTTSGNGAVAIDVNASGNTAALDWKGLNFLNCTKCVEAAGFSFLVWVNGAMISCNDGFDIDGSCNGVIFETCNSVNMTTGANIFKLASGSTVNSRIRFSNSSLRPTTGVTTFNIGDITDIPSESFVIDSCNVDGVGTVVAGASQNNVQTLWKNNIGLISTQPSGSMLLTSNTTETTISVSSTYYPALGTYTYGDLQRFSSSTNGRLTYTGSKERKFQATLVGNLHSGNNKDIKIAILKNGSTLSDSEIELTTTGNGDFLNFSTLSQFSLTENDYLEFAISNETDTSNITVDRLTLLVKEL